MSQSEVLLNGRPLESYRVVDLKQELEKLGLSKSGAKKDLINRLAKELKKQNQPNQSTTLPQVNIDEGLAGNDFVKDYLALRETQFQQAIGSPPKEDKKEIESEPEPEPQTKLVASPSKKEKIVDKIEPEPQQPPSDDNKQEQSVTETPKEIPIETEPKVEKTETPKKPEQEKPQIIKSPSPKKSPQKEDKSKVEDVKKDETTASKDEEEDSVLEIEPKDSDLIDSKTDSPLENEDKKESESADDTNVSIRRIGNPVIQRHKRQWSSNKSKSSEQQPEDSGTISSANLKDIIPDIKPILNENTDDKIQEEEKVDDDKEKNQVPLDIDNSSKIEETSDDKKQDKSESEEEKVEKQTDQQNQDEKMEVEDSSAKQEEKKPEILDTVNVMEEEPEDNIDDESVSEFIHITNLVRPFTLNQLKELLNRTGTLVDNFFAINKIKSQCIVKYSSKKESKETKSALDGVKWPNSNPKILKVEFSSESEFKKLLDESDPSSRKRPNESEPNIESKKKKLDSSNETKHHHSSKEQKKPPKPLDDLFRRTKATPCIYWRQA